MNTAVERSPSASLTGTLDDILTSFTPDDSLPYPREAQVAVHIAGLLQRRANDLQTPQEKKQQHELERMVQNPHDKATMIQMTDQAFRSSRARRAVDQLPLRRRCDRRHVQHGPLHRAAGAVRVPGIEHRHGGRTGVAGAQPYA